MLSNKRDAGAPLIFAGKMRGGATMRGMTPSDAPPGTWPLFTYRGIRVFLHWSWLLVAVYQINERQGRYPHVGWDIAFYLTLFGIVLLHEFGHSFATRQVGGVSNQIMLWPFGGIAFVQVPPRPKAYLWAIAAGPLVNVVMWPVLYLAVRLYADPFNFAATYPRAEDGSPDAWPYFLFNVFRLNTVLIIFNLIPAYPLDGGQLLRGLLWLKLGEVRSLVIAAWVGIVLGGIGVVLALLWLQSIFTAIMLGLMMHQAWMHLQSVRDYRTRTDAGDSWKR